MMTERTETYPGSGHASVALPAVGTPANVCVQRRYLPAAVRNVIELDHNAPHCRLTSFWFAAPNAPGAAVRALAPDHELDQVDQISGYLIDAMPQLQETSRVGQAPGSGIARPEVQTL